MDRLEKLDLWPLRFLWLVHPGIAGQAIVSAADDWSSGVRIVLEVGLWIGWFTGLVAVLYPSTHSLTWVRTVAPMFVALAVIVAVSSSTWTPPVLVAIGFSIVLLVVTFLPLTGDRMVNGAAFGSERRMALRPPAAVLLGPLQLAWAAVFFGAFTGPLLLGSGRLIGGIIASVFGVGLVIVGLRSLHQLSRRWIVFVPAGFVIHDYLSLAESILIQRRQKPKLGPAAADPVGLLDLSGGALGLALAVQFDEDIPVALRRQKTVESTSAHGFVFTPTLPGALLQEARVRAITIG